MFIESGLYTPMGLYSPNVYNLKIKFDSILSLTPPPRLCAPREPRWARSAARWPWPAARSSGCPGCGTRGRAPRASPRPAPCRVARHSATAPTWPTRTDTGSRSATETSRHSDQLELAVSRNGSETLWLCLDRPSTLRGGIIVKFS